MLTLELSALIPRVCASLIFSVAFCVRNQLSMASPLLRVAVPPTNEPADTKEDGNTSETHSAVILEGGEIKDLKGICILTTCLEKRIDFIDEISMKPRASERFARLKSNYALLCRTYP
jgi:hypothetical protein